MHQEIFDKNLKLQDEGEEFLLSEGDEGFINEENKNILKRQSS